MLNGIIEKAPKIILIFFVVLVPLIFLSQQVWVSPETHYIQLFTSVKEVAARILTLILYLIFMVQVAFFNKPILKTPLYVPLFLLWLYQGISLFWAENVYQGIEHWVRWGMLFLFFFVCFNVVRKEDVPKYIAASLVTAFFVCTLGVVSFFWTLDFPFFKYRDFSWSATFATHKFAGEYLLPLIFWAIGFSLLKREDMSSPRKRGSRRSLYLGLSLFFIFTLFFVFQSRSSLLALFLLIPLLLYWGRGKLKYLSSRELKVRGILDRDSSHFVFGMTRIFIAGIGVIFLILFLPRSKEALQNLRSMGDIRFVTNIERLVMWKNTARIIADQPVRGVGIGNFDLAYHHRLPSQDRYLSIDFDNWAHYSRQAHNEYLQILSEGGIIAFLFFIFFIGFLVRGSVVYLKKHKEDSFFFCLFLSFLSMLILACFVFNFQISPTSYFFMLTAVFLWKWFTPKSKQKVTTVMKGGDIFPSGAGRWASAPSGKYLPLFSLRRIIVLIFFAIILPISLKPLTRPVFVDYYRKLGQSVMEASVHRPSDQRSIAIFQKALGWNPNDWEIHYLIANAYGDRGLYLKALDHAKRSFELNPSHIQTLYNIGIYHEKMGNPKMARQIYQDLLSKAPNFGRANNRMGYLFLTEGNVAQSRLYFRKTLEQFPYEPLEMNDALIGNAHCELKEANHGGAKSYLFETFFIHQENINSIHFLKPESPLFRWWLAGQ